jgi:hypothetical protein
VLLPTSTLVTAFLSSANEPTGISQLFFSFSTNTTFCSLFLLSDLIFVLFYEPVSLNKHATYIMTLSSVTSEFSSAFQPFYWMLEQIQKKVFINYHFYSRLSEVVLRATGAFFKVFSKIKRRFSASKSVF